MLGTILLIILVLLVIGSLPAWSYSRGWGYRGTGLFGILLVLLIIALLAGWI
jgi:hypothetical protein